MRFNSTVREEPYQGLKPQRTAEETWSVFTRDVGAGAAWLPSARDLNCSLQWGNERNPYLVLYVSRETAVFNTEEGEDDVKSAWPFDTLGHTHATMDGTMGCQTVRWSQSHQNHPQFGLRAETRPHEVGIASNRASAMAR